MINSYSVPVDYPIVDRTIFLSYQTRLNIKAKPAYSSLIKKINKHRNDPNYKGIWSVFRLISKSIFSNELLINQSTVSNKLVDLYNRGLPYFLMAQGVKLAITIWKLKLEEAGRSARVIRKLVIEGLHITNILFKSEFSELNRVMSHPMYVIGDTYNLKYVKTSVIIDYSQRPELAGIGIAILSDTLELDFSFRTPNLKSSEGERAALDKALFSLIHLEILSFRLITDSLNAYFYFKEAVKQYPQIKVCQVVLSDRISTFRADRLACSFSF